MSDQPQLAPLTEEQTERRLNRFFWMAKQAFYGLAGTVILMIVLGLPFVQDQVDTELLKEHLDTLLWCFTAIILAWMTGEVASGFIGKKR